MAKATSVIDEVRALIPQTVGVRPWWERLDATQSKMVAEILEAWHGGVFGTQRRTAARAISQTLKRHGIDIGEQGVEGWLRRNAKS